MREGRCFTLFHVKHRPERLEQRCVGCYFSGFRHSSSEALPLTVSV